MGRAKVKRKRIGHKEAASLRRLVERLKAYKIFQDDKGRRETKFNDRLIDYLRQNDVAVVNKNIATADFVGETFRPEFLLKGTGSYPLCAVECKRLTDKYAKARWKEGLSQALLYMHYYKAVVYLLYDFTKDASYSKAFGKGNRPESRFAKLLRDELDIRIIVLNPR